MILHDGETVFVSFTTGGNLSEPPRAWVTEAVVVDAKHGIVREPQNGDRVRVLQEFEGVHQCRGAAWAQCSIELGAFAAAIRAKADECAREAAKLEVAVA
jgi:hypothetical protein